MTTKKKQPKWASVLDAQEMYDSELIKLQKGLAKATTRHEIRRMWSAFRLQLVIIEKLCRSEKDFELRTELRGFLLGRQSI